MTYKLSPEADRDIEDIAKYTLTEWGEKQALKYLQELDLAFQKIADNPELGRKRHDIKKGIFSRLYQQHVIFYQYRDNTLYILRILHQTRDIKIKS